MTRTAPYKFVNPTDATPTYQGDEGAVTATIGPDSLTLNTPGSNQQLFNSVFNTLKTLKTDLTNAAGGAAGSITAISNNVGSLDTNLNGMSTARRRSGRRSTKPMPSRSA